MQLLQYLKARKRQSQPSTISLPLLQLMNVEEEMCKPVPYPVEEWSHPKPAEVELLVPAESEAGQNIQNPKVLSMLGIRSVVRFDMLPSGTSVLLAK